MKPLSVYIHIPFCVKKCAYCDFLSAPADCTMQDAYVTALCKEIVYEKQSYVNHIVRTVFIGGGTPSILKSEAIIQILQTITDNYQLSQDCEITIEVNPGTTTKEKLQAYLKAGINRLSIGLQSTVDDELRLLGRIHNYRDFKETYQDAVKSGFNNINIDLMSAIPEQTLKSYQTTLHRVAQLKPAPTHISAYSLMIEENTPFYEQTPELPDEECEREMYKITNVILSQYGYHRYEISNYALTGYDCRHNQVYWRRGEYVGFGIGAASLVNQTRFSNCRDLVSYVNRIRNGESCKENVQSLTIQERMEEFMFLGLRMMSGVSTREFTEQFGRTIEEIYPGLTETLNREGLLKRVVIPADADDRIVLTDLGIDVSNRVMAEFILTE